MSVIIPFYFWGWAVWAACIGVIAEDLAPEKNNVVDMKQWKARR